MAEILYHIVFSKPKQLSRFFLSLFLPMSIILTTIILALNLVSRKDTDIVIVMIIVVNSTAFIFSLLVTLIEKKKGADIPQDEFILYDNGWFVFWCVEPDEGWIAPAKLDWVLPPAKPMKELEKELGVQAKWLVLFTEKILSFEKEKERSL